MENEEYNNRLKGYKSELDKKIRKIIRRSLLGLVTSSAMLAYNNYLYDDFIEQTSLINAFNGPVIEEVYIRPLNHMQRTQDAAMLLGGASGLYLLVGSGINYLRYRKKKKALEQNFKK